MICGVGGGLISKDSSIALYANDSKLYRLSGRSTGGAGPPPPHILSEKKIIVQKRKASRARDKKPASPH